MVDLMSLDPSLLPRELTIETESSLAAMGDDEVDTLLLRLRERLIEQRSAPRPSRLEMDIENLDLSQIEDAIARLEAEKQARDAGRLERLSTLSGDEFVSEILKLEALAWMRKPGLVEAIQRATTIVDQSGAPSVSLKDEHRENPLPPLVEPEDLAGVDKT